MKGCFSHRIFTSGRVPTLEEIKFAFLTQSLEDGRFLTNLRKERLKEAGLKEAVSKRMGLTRNSPPPRID